jgi:hypothetical protein
MKLEISTDLALPRDVVTQKLAWMGRTGSGKTYGFGRMAEAMLDAGMQVVILDPVGVHWGLRLSADGKGDGIKTILVFGGLHRDVPLEPTSGRVIADFLADRRVSAVLDVSQFESDADKARFATDWAGRFFFRYKAKPSPVHVCLEECQEFVPQNAMKGEERMVHAFNRMWKLGRNFGIGGSLISQRPQEVNKKALNQTECFFAFQMTGPHERKAVEEWMKEKGVDLDIAGDLPKLQVGCAHVWSPQWLRISKEVRIDKKQTFNASSTPEFGAKQVEIKPLEPIEIEKLSADLKASIEKAKADDPAALRERIRRLEAAANSAKPRVDESAVSRALERGKHEAQRESSARIRTLESTIVRQQGTMKKAAEMLAGAAVDVPKYVAPPVVETSPAARKVASWGPAPRAHAGSDAEISVKVPKGERIILIATAQHDEGVERDQLTVLTGYKRSSRDAYLQRLKERGLVVVEGDRIRVTEEGMAALGGSFEPLPTGGELVRYHLERLPEGERVIFDYLVRAYPRVVPRDELSDQTEYKRSSRDAYLHRLKARRLIEIHGSGISASQRLFV